VAMAECAAVWVGPPPGSSGTATHLQLTFNQLRWAAIAVDGDGCPTDVSEGLPPTVSRILGKRYFLMEKAKEAAIVGLLVGTLGVAGYGDAIAALRRLVEDSGRTCYTVLVGKPSPAKLANFPEIEVFVIIGCPQGVVLDSKEYLSPIITPHEARLAFSEQDWDPADYRLDFHGTLESLAASGCAEGCHEGPKDGAAAEASTALVAKQGGMSLAPRQGDGQLQAANAAEYLRHKRSYVGLETPATGAEAKAVEKAVPGLSGRAAGYRQEPDI